VFLCLLGTKWSGRLWSPPAAAMCGFCVPRVRPELTSKVSMQAHFTPMVCYRETEEEPPVEAKVEKPIPVPKGYKTLVFKLDVPPWVPPHSRWEEQHMCRIFAIPKNMVSLLSGPNCAARVVHSQSSSSLHLRCTQARAPQTETQA
jgi:hypothetical protein